MKTRIWLLAAVLTAAVACGDDQPTDVPSRTVAVVEVDPAAATVPVGDTIRLTARPMDADGQVLEGVTVAWSSETAELAAVTPQGMHGRVSATRAGLAVITAAAGGKVGQVQISITNPIPAITILEPASAVAGSGVATLVVHGTRFVRDAQVVWNGEGRPTTYVSPTQLRATLAAADLASQGPAVVHVVAPLPGGGSSQALTFTVTPAPPPPPPPVGPVASVEIDLDSLALEEGGQAQLSAVARDAQGQIVTGRFVGWTSSDPEVAAVEALGAVRAIRAGSATITARVDGAQASIPVRVSSDYAYQLVFAGWDGAAMRLYELDPNDSSRTHARIGADVPGADPVPSPDGRRIAFVGMTEGGLRALYTVGVDGSGLSRLLTTSDISCGQMTWSPDGVRIAFACRIDGDDLDIWAMDASDGGNLVNLTDSHPHNQDWPSWSPRLPDGSYRIAYAQYVNGEPQIWTMKPDGSDPKRITSGMDWQPAWSPDATRIAFQRTGVAIFGDIWVVDADGGNERQLVGAYLAGPQWSPTWSPDGRLLAFASTHETYGSGATVGQIYTVRADGSGLARRTTGGLYKQDPAWRVR